MNPRRDFGPRRLTKADNQAAFESLLVMRTKPVRDNEIAGLARSFGIGEDAVRDRLRLAGLLEGQAHG